MNNIYKLNSIIEYIEKNICTEIDLNIPAKMMGLSLYEFRRIFSFAAGVPIGEYIRKRRMTLAAGELIDGKKSVTELAAYYGYDSPSSFTRAFKEFHGGSPTELATGEKPINMLTRLSFDIRISGGVSTEYRLLRDDKFYIYGVSGKSGIEDTECCEAVWDDFYKSNAAAKLSAVCGGKIYSAYDNGDNSVVCNIGARCDNKADEHAYPVPSALWMCFTARGADDAVINGFYNDILFKHLSSCGYKRARGIPNLEVYPEDMSSDDFEWEIRIPVELAAEGK